MGLDVFIGGSIAAGIAYYVLKSVGWFLNERLGCFFGSIILAIPLYFYGDSHTKPRLFNPPSKANTQRPKQQTQGGVITWQKTRPCFF